MLSNTELEPFLGVLVLGLVMAGLALYIIGMFFWIFSRHTKREYVIVAIIHVIIITALIVVEKIQ